MPDLVKPSFVILTSGHSDAQDWASECQSARMSKITNDGLTRSDTGFYIAVSIWQQWVSKGSTRQCCHHFGMLLFSYRIIWWVVYLCSPRRVRWRRRSSSTDRASSRWTLRPTTASPSAPTRTPSTTPSTWRSPCRMTTYRRCSASVGSSWSASETTCRVWIERRSTLRSPTTPCTPRSSTSTH